MPDIGYRAIARLSAPILVANISIIGSGTIDTIMAGRLGAEHLAAVAIGNATVIMVILTLVGVIQSLSPLAGHHFGAHRFERIGFELTQSLWLSLVLGFVGLLDFPVQCARQCRTDASHLSSGKRRERPGFYVGPSLCGAQRRRQSAACDDVGLDRPGSTESTA